MRSSKTWVMRTNGGLDPLDPALHQPELGVVAQAEVVQPRSLDLATSLELTRLGGHTDLPERVNSKVWSGSRAAEAAGLRSEAN